MLLLITCTAAACHFACLLYVCREHKKIMMEMEDLLNRMHDINSMKVTREIQNVCVHD